mgnify:CR=1 FL=1
MQQKKTIGYSIKNLGSWKEYWRRWRKEENEKTEESRRNYKKLNNELRRETNKAKEEWLSQKCEEMDDLERKGK